LGGSVFSLTGPKHCGKSETGKEAAARAGGVFIDLDDLIEEHDGRTPRELYQAGREIFQDAEARSVDRALEKAAQSAGPVFIAAGGGIIDNPGAFTALKNSSYIIYLELSSDAAWERIERAARNGQGIPPFLKGDDPRKVHRELHERRAAAYRKEADFVINAEHKTVPELSKEIKDLMSCLPQRRP
jgi:shikimate kinase